MKQHVWKFAGTLLAAMTIIALAIVAARPTFAQQLPTTTGRNVTVVGRGDIKVRPDTAIVQIGVDIEGKTVKEALAQNNQQAAAIQKKLADLGVDAKDIQTSGFNIFPTYGTDGRQVTGYRVMNTVTVKIRAIDKTGSLLDEVVQAGANSVYGISFTVDNPRTFEDQAREAAMRDAKARADLLARAGGASVGEVLIITENVGSAVPIAMPMERAAVANDSSVPVQPGEQSVSISVQVTYSLK
jgi:uncharacterized protein